MSSQQQEYGKFATPKGTVLYLMEIKGKPYLQVQERIIWFREEHPKGRIKTHIVRTSDLESVFYAEILDENGNLLASAHKHETKKGFDDHLEKAETGAIGRALALCGFGTQFTALEFHEGQRLADAPSGRPQAQPETRQEPPWPDEEFAPTAPPEPTKPHQAAKVSPFVKTPPPGLRVPLGAARRFKPTFGKYKNTAIGEVSVDNLKSYIRFLNESGKPLGQPARDFVAAAMSIIDSEPTLGIDADEPLPL